MGDFFKQTSAESRVDNRQIGVQGTDNVVNSGDVGRSFASNGGLAIGDITGQVHDIFVESSDKDVSLASINAGQGVALKALETLQDSQDRALATAAGSLARAADLAEKATPLSSGDLALAIDSGRATAQTKIMIAGGVLIGVAVVVFIYKKKK